MKTDIDRLHKTINNKLTLNFRRSGKTTISLHVLAGQIQVGNMKRINIRVKFYKDKKWLIPRMQEIFREQGISFGRNYLDNYFAFYEQKRVELQFFCHDIFFEKTQGDDALEMDLIDY
jgi:hypothetical protein